MRLWCVQRFPSVVRWEGGREAGEREIESTSSPYRAKSTWLREALQLWDTPHPITILPAVLQTAPKIKPRCSTFSCHVPLSLRSLLVDGSCPVEDFKDTQRLWSRWSVWRRWCWFTIAKWPPIIMLLSCASSLWIGKDFIFKKRGKMSLLFCFPPFHSNQCIQLGLRVDLHLGNRT